MTTWRLALDPFVTPLFRAWWRMRRAMTLGVQGVATDDQGRVMLIRHTYRPGWFFPGGGIEAGETALEALTREMAEEAGLAIVGKPKLIGFFSNRAVFKDDHIALYRIEGWTPCAPLENGEIAERAFFALDALPEGVSKGTERRIAEIFGTTPASCEW